MSPSRSRTLTLTAMRAAALLAACGCVCAAGAEPKYPPVYYQALKFLDRRGRELGLKYELKEQAAVPPWAKNEPRPRFRFVQITDIHFTPRLAPLLRDALRFIRVRVRPAFVVNTGDVAPERAMPLFRRVWKEGLGDIPTFGVRGDNWPFAYTRAFGSSDWSFECGGVGFVAAALDRDIINLGIGVFEPDTWAWLKRSLDAQRGRPAIFFMHENLLPPTFLDAPKLLKMIQARPWVVATVTGHLHYDYQTRVAGQLHMVGPGFGPNPAHPFKVFEVRSDHITVRTVKRRGGAFRFVTLYQRIDFPPGMRLQGAAARRPKIEHFSARPARDVTVDISLAGRMMELVPHLLAFIPLTGRSEEIWADFGELAAAALGGGARPSQKRPKAVKGK